MAAYSIAIGTPPMSQGMLIGSSSFTRAQPMRIPTRGHSTRASGTNLLEPMPSVSTSLHSIHETSASYMNRYVSLSASGRQRRPSVASSPTVSEASEPNNLQQGSSNIVSIAGFAPKAVTVGFDTASSRAIGVEVAGSAQRVSPFKAGPPSPTSAANSGKPPVPPAPCSNKQGLLSKALSLSDMPQAGFQPPKEGSGQMFFPDVDLKPLYEVQEDYPVFKSELVVTAYCVAARAHRTQLRKSGAPLLSHCLEVAKILASTGCDEQTVTAGLLHEVLGMHGSSLYQAQLEEFMPTEVMSLVERVNTISEMSRIYRKHREDFGDEKFRRMLVAMEDVKAVLVKLADRVHNMRTLGCLPREKQVLLAQETLEVYSVVANRLGVWCLKAELEDLAFKALHPEEYAWLQAQVADRQDAAALEATMRSIRKAMLEHGVQVEDISGRPKNLWGIWCKLQADGHRDVSRIYDVQALRVVVSNKHECYMALRALESVYRCMPERSKDFIRDIRKPNGYQSLHETVWGEGGRQMEVQIRTHKMHYIAEYGFAAHWKYKEKLDSEDQWVEKETQYKRWLTQYKLGLLDKKVRPQGAAQKDQSLHSLGVAFLDQVTEQPDAVDPFLRNDRFRLMQPMKSDVSVLLQTQDGVDTRSFPLGTTAAQLWDVLGVNDTPGFAVTVNSRLPMGECALRSGDLVQVVPLSNLLEREVQRTASAAVNAVGSIAIAGAELLSPTLLAAANAAGIMGAGAGSSFAAAGAQQSAVASLIAAARGLGIGSMGSVGLGHIGTFDFQAHTLSAPPSSGPMAFASGSMRSSMEQRRSRRGSPSMSPSPSAGMLLATLSGSSSSRAGAGREKDSMAGNGAKGMHGRSAYAFGRGLVAAGGF